MGHASYMQRFVLPIVQAFSYSPTCVTSVACEYTFHP